MHLEDHIGDIIKKGRLMSGVSPAAAASAAGVTADEGAEAAPVPAALAAVTVKV